MLMEPCRRCGKPFYIERATQLHCNKCEVKMKNPCKEQIIKKNDRIKVTRPNEHYGKRGIVLSYCEGWYKVRLDDGAETFENMFGLIESEV